MFYFNKNIIFTNSNFKRSGVIPFTYYNKQLYFLMGIDKKSGDYTDFGGGVKKYETFIDAAYRELMEESCNIFKNHININNIKNSIVLTNYNNSSAIYFVYIDNLWIKKAVPFFNNNKLQYLSSSYQELQNIKWINQKHFKNISFSFYNNFLWTKIKLFLMSNTNWIELYFCLLLSPSLKP